MNVPLAVGAAQRRRTPQGVQDQLPMAEIDPFGIAGGAGGIEGRGLGIFVKVGKIVIR